MNKNTFHNKTWNALKPILAKPLVPIKMNMEKLNRELAEAGAPTAYEHHGRRLSPLEALVNGRSLLDLT